MYQFFSFNYCDYQIQLSSGGLKCGMRVILQKVRIPMDTTAN